MFNFISFVTHLKLLITLNQKDKIKIIIALILVSINLVAYFFVGKEGYTLKIISGSSLGIWLLTMYFTNKKS